jgi:hypothetical protein
MKLGYLLTALVLSTPPEVGVCRADTILTDFRHDTPDMPYTAAAWRCFTDRVMGGVSDASHRMVLEADTQFLRLEGTVSLENNGGFIQSALPLDPDRADIWPDAEGVVLMVRGTPGTRYVHLRTTDCRRPWEHYRAGFTVEREWKRVAIPFNSFAGVSTSAPLDIGALTRVGLVAAKEAGSVVMDVAWVGVFAEATPVDTERAAASDEDATRRVPKGGTE